MSTIKSCWTNNCRGARDSQLYVIHAHGTGNTAICGVVIQEIGDAIPADMVDCKNCQRKLRKLAEAKQNT